MSLLYCPGSVATGPDGTIKCSQPVRAMTSQEIQTELGYASALNAQDYKQLSDHALLMFVIAFCAKALINVVKDWR